MNLGAATPFVVVLNVGMLLAYPVCLGLGALWWRWRGEARFLRQLESDVQAGIARRKAAARIPTDPVSPEQMHLAWKNSGEEKR